MLYTKILSVADDGERALIESIPAIATKALINIWDYLQRPDNDNVLSGIQ